MTLKDEKILKECKAEKSIPKSEKKKRLKCYLYVLRYKHSGNYYVGSTTGDLDKRMIKHSKDNNKRTPHWSRVNKSSEGFDYYWFCVHENVSSYRKRHYKEKDLQSIGDRCENELIKEFCEKIEEIKKCNPNSNRKVYAMGGFKTKKEDYKDIEKEGYPRYDVIDEILDSCLRSLSYYIMPIKQGNFYISYLRKGYMEGTKNSAE